MRSEPRQISGGGSTLNSILECNINTVLKQKHGNDNESHKIIKNKT